MTCEDGRTIVRIFHYDDETASVLPIANSLHNLYYLYRRRWLLTEETKFDSYVSRFVLRPHDGCDIEIKYELSDDIDICKGNLSAMGPGDIAILDLMRDSAQGKTQLVGRDLYELALHTVKDRSRLIVLSGFPNLFQEAGFAIHKDLAWTKPLDSTDAARRLAKLLPKAVALSIDDEGTDENGIHGGHRI